ncbi:unnamed protein product [Leptidea sinapis]|uniref:Uncharacterized protein n=1 Tax=Leptidea sinapis TaxID=189913 RepID=A0A5E4QD29_9NEOP|nr:unnamed protein product [Leptidea sinapis]
MAIPVSGFGNVSTISEHLTMPNFNSVLCICSRSWSVAEDWSNYSTWRYTVRYECGARCGGQAEVTHRRGGDSEAPSHSHSRVHRLLVHIKQCSRLPLLSWPQYCEESEVETQIVSGGGSSSEGRGALLVERTYEWCGAVRAAALRCAPHRHRMWHLQALREALRS